MTYPVLHGPQQRRWQEPSEGFKGECGRFGPHRANPASEITVTPELELVKAALLYGDSVVLISPVTTMLLGVEALEPLSLSQQVQLVCQVRALFDAGREVTRFLAGLDQIETIFSGSPRTGWLARVATDPRELEQTLAPVKEKLASVARGIASRPVLDQLASARMRRLLVIDSAVDTSWTGPLQQCRVITIPAKMQGPASSIQPSYCIRRQTTRRS